MKKSFVLEVNKEIMVVNMIKNYQWDNISIKESFNKKVEYYIEDKTLESDMNEQEIKLYLKNYLIDLASNKNIFDKFLKRLYESHMCKSFKKLMEENSLEFKNKNDLQLFINQMVVAVNY